MEANQRGRGPAFDGSLLAQRAAEIGVQCELHSVGHRVRLRLVRRVHAPTETTRGIRLEGRGLRGAAEMGPRLRRRGHSPADDSQGRGDEHRGDAARKVSPRGHGHPSRARGKRGLRHVPQVDRLAPARDRRGRRQRAGEVAAWTKNCARISQQRMSELTTNNCNQTTHRQPRRARLTRRPARGGTGCTGTSTRSCTASIQADAIQMPVGKGGHPESDGTRKAEEYLGM